MHERRLLRGQRQRAMCVLAMCVRALYVFLYRVRTLVLHSGRVFFPITLAITAAKYGRAFDNAKKVRLNLVANFNATERAAAVMLL